MKIVNLLYIAPLAMLSVFLKSCLTMEAPIYCIHSYNQTEDELYALYRWDCEYTEQYTKIVLSEDSSLYSSMKMSPDWAPSLWCFSEKPENFLKPTDTLTIFILDKDEYEGKTWSQLVDSAHFRQIYHLSGDDIRLIGTKIPYPPTEIMRNMDMVPSYVEAVR